MFPDLYTIHPHCGMVIDRPKPQNQALGIAFRQRRKFTRIPRDGVKRLVVDPAQLRLGRVRNSDRAIERIRVLEPSLPNTDISIIEAEAPLTGEIGPVRSGKLRIRSVAQAI